MYTINLCLSSISVQKSSETFDRLEYRKRVWINLVACSRVCASLVIGQPEYTLEVIDHQHPRSLGVSFVKGRTT